MDQIKGNVCIKLLKNINFYKNQLDLLKLNLRKNAKKYKYKYYLHAYKEFKKTYKPIGVRMGSGQGDKHTIYYEFYKNSFLIHLNFKYMIDFANLSAYKHTVNYIISKILKDFHNIQYLILFTL